MWCLSKDESKRWCEGFDFVESGLPKIDKFKYRVTAPFAQMPASRLHWLARLAASHLEPFDECLLWVTQWEIWPSSENFHLFYRLRESYGERRRLVDAPGHLFLKHENADLATFISLGLWNGWDFYLLPDLGNGAAFVSHDEVVELHTNDKDVAAPAKELLPGASVTPSD